MRYRRDPPSAGGGEATLQAGGAIRAHGRAGRAGDRGRDPALPRGLHQPRGARALSVELKRYASAHGVSTAGAKPRRTPRSEEVPPGDRVVLAGGPLLAMDLGSGPATRSLGEPGVRGRREPRCGRRDARARRSPPSSPRVSSSARPIASAPTTTRSISRSRSGRSGSVAGLELLAHRRVRGRSSPRRTSSPTRARCARRAWSAPTSIARASGGLLKAPKRFDGNALLGGGPEPLLHHRGRRGPGARARRDLVRPSGARCRREPSRACRQGSKPEQEVVDQLAGGRSAFGPGSGPPLRRSTSGPASTSGSPRSASARARRRSRLDLGAAVQQGAARSCSTGSTRFVKNYGVAILVLATLVRRAAPSAEHDEHEEHARDAEAPARDRADPARSTRTIRRR